MAGLTEETGQRIAEALEAANRSGGNRGSNRDPSESVDWSGFGTAVGRSSVDLLKFGSTLFSSGARVSDAVGTASSVISRFAPMLGTTIGDISQNLGDGAEAIIKAAEAGVDSFRTLSESGAAFNNDILLLKNSAAQSRLTLDEFAGIVSENTAGFAAFGGTVTKGAQLFTRASQDMFDKGLATPLLNMGFTFEEINENLASYMTLNRRRFNEEEIRNGTAAASMIAMSTEMDKIAKLTGQNRKELEKEINDRARKGQVEAKIRMLEASGNEEAADKMRLALAEAAKAGPGALAAVEDLFTKGAVVSEEGRQAAVALGPAFSNLQGIVAAASGPGGIESMQSSIDGFNSAVSQRINDPQFLQMATLGGMGNGFADAAAGLVETAGTYADNVQAMMDEEGISREAAIRRLDELAAEEQGSRDGVTSTIINGEKAIRDLGAVINDTLLGADGAITQLSDAILPFAERLENLNRLDIQAPVDATVDNITGAVNDIVQGQPTLEPPDPQSRPEDIRASQATINDMRSMLQEMQGMQGMQETDAYALAASLGSTMGPLVAEALRQSAEENFGGDLRAQIEELLLRGPSDEIISTVKELYQHQNPNASNLDLRMLDTSLRGGPGSVPIEELLQGSLDVVDRMSVGSIEATNITLPGREFGGPVEKDQAYVVGERRAELFVPQQNGFIVPSISNLETSISGAMSQVQAPTQQMITSIDTSQLEAIMQDFASNMQTTLSSDNTQESFREVAEMLNTNLQEQTGLLANQARTARKQLKSLGGLGGNLFRGIG